MLDLLLTRAVARTFRKGHECDVGLSLFRQPAFWLESMRLGEVPFIHVHAGDRHANNCLAVLS